MEITKLDNHRIAIRETREEVRERSLSSLLQERDGLAAALANLDALIAEAGRLGVTEEGPKSGLIVE